MTKNILLVISKFPPEYSGPGVRIPRLYKWFKEQGYEYNLKVLCNGIEHQKNEKYIHDGLAVQRVSAGMLYKVFGFLPARISKSILYQVEFIQSLIILFFSKEYKNIDFLHVAGHSGATSAALIWAKCYKIPVLMELVTEYARHVQKYLFVFKARVPENSMVVSLTEKAKEECIAMGLDQNKIWSRPNPINDNKFKPDFENKFDLRKKLTPFDDSHIVIGNVAKMMPQKNQFLILKMLPHLPEEYVAVIAGPLVKEGPLHDRDMKYFSDMEKFVQNNNLQQRVHFVTGFVEAELYMKLSDVYAMPAWNEGFGTPMMEAMGCGLPVVANKHEIAFKEWIVPEKNGFLCDIENPREWAQAIEKSSKFTENHRKEMSQEIHKKAGQEAIYTHYESLFKSLMGE